MRKMRPAQEEKGFTHAPESHPSPFPKVRDGYRKSAKRSAPKPHPSRRDAGFTIVEALVALGLFSVVVTIAVGGFITSLKAQRRIAALMAANNNVVLALEQMAREVRTGRNFCPGGGGCAPGRLRFYNASGDVITYLLNAGSLLRIVAVVGGGPPAAGRLTGDNVAIRYLNFRRLGEAVNDDWPTRVTISLGLSAKGAAGVGDVIVRLQTTVTSRQQDEP